MEQRTLAHDDNYGIYLHRPEITFSIQYLLSPATAPKMLDKIPCCFLTSKHHLLACIIYGWREVSLSLGMMSKERAKEWWNMKCTKCVCGWTKVLPKRKESFECRVLLGKVFQGRFHWEGSKPRGRWFWEKESVKSLIVGSCFDAIKMRNKCWQTQEVTPLGIPSQLKTLLQ